MTMRSETEWTSKNGKIITGVRFSQSSKIIELYQSKTTSKGVEKSVIKIDSSVMTNEDAGDLAASMMEACDITLPMEPEKKPAWADDGDEEEEA